MADRRRGEHTRVRGDMDFDYPVPKKEEVLTMARAPKSIRLDDGEVVVKIRIGDDVVIVPSTLELGVHPFLTEKQLWRGRLVHIGWDPENTDPRTREVWLVVAWYYSPSEVKNLLNIRGFNAEDCGTRELSFVPSHTDVVHLDTVEALANVYWYDEDNFDQKEIPKHAFYFRGEWNHNRERWITKRPEATCLCRERFNPYEDGVMHYCARPGCHKWYHASCLEEKRWIDSTSLPLDIELQWELSIDIDDKHAPLAQSLPHEEKRSASSAGRTRRQHGHHADPYEHVPEELLQLARRPVVRGGEHGVVGNGAVVLRARVVVDRVVRRGEMLPEDWFDLIWFSEEVVRVPAPPVSLESSAGDEDGEDQSASHETGVHTGKTSSTGRGKAVDRSKRWIQEIRKTPRLGVGRELPEFEHPVTSEGMEFALRCPGCGKVI